MTVTRLVDDRLQDVAVPAFRLESRSGFVAVISAYGARLLLLIVPDDKGGTDVVMGSPAPRHFVDGDRFAGAICGRYANRIEGAEFELDGVRHRLMANEGRNQLHGGPNSFSDRIWAAEADKDGVVLKLSSDTGDQGFPGKLDVAVSYNFDGQTLSLDMQARTDAPTVVNLTQHAYWNLAGAGSIRGHRLTIPAARYIAVDLENIPVGSPTPVDSSEFDFRSPQSLDERLKSRPQGFDHNFCLRGTRGALHLAALLEHPSSGRSMAVSTTEPGLQVYTAQHFGPGLPSKPGRILERFGAIALEPQTWPNAPNQPAFPSAVLRPGETYRHRIEWRFDGFS